MDKNQEYYDEIARVAYEIYEKRGGLPGFELENWLDAERAVMERINAQTPPPKKRPSRASASPKTEPSKTASTTRSRKTKKPEVEV